MEAIMKVSSNKMKSVDMESTTGQMENNTKVNGVIIKCMEKAPLSGKTRKSTKVNS